MRQLATRITPNLGNCNWKIDQTMVWFSLVLWIFSVHRTEPANTRHSSICCCCSLVVGCHITNGDVACFLCEKRRGGGEVHYSPQSIWTWQQHVSSPSGWHGMSVAVVTVHCCCLSTGLVMWHCHVVVIVGVVGGGWMMIVVGGGSGDEAEVVMVMVVWWWLRRKSFVCWWCKCDVFGKHCSLYIRIWMCEFCLPFEKLGR